MIRRFVNVVAENSRTCAYTVHRLDVSKHLFHQSRADARAMPLLAEAQDSHGDEQPTTLDWLQELPAPCVQIQPTFVREQWPRFRNLPFWALLSPRSSEDKFLCVNRMGDTMLCHADKPSVDPMPQLQEEVVLDHISFSVVRPEAQDQQEEEDLYVIHNLPVPEWDAYSSRFHLLRKDADGWRWESLPRPPFVRAPSHTMYSYTVVDGGRTICFSCAKPGIGTYCFNTVERQWRHAADWCLPFVGRAEYVPDLHLWLGFSVSPDSLSYHLCATSDLNAMYVDHPPELQHVWQDLVTPGNWSPGWTQLVSLGSRRFCIAKSFDIGNRRTGKCISGFEEEWWEFQAEVTVLTGIEVGWDDDDGRLKVWKHRSVEYVSGYSVQELL